MKSTTKNLSAVISATLLLLTTNVARAQTDDDFGAWLSVNAQGKLPADGFNWHTDFQFRWRDNAQEFDQFIARPAVFYKFSEQGSVWLGYANAQTHTLRLGPIEEHRIWQQFLFTHKLGSATLQSRTRLEQRSLDSGDDVGHRLRQMLRVVVPLAQAPKFSLVGTNEVFVNLNRTDWGALSGFDRNRLFLGLGYNASASVRLEMGYLNQYVNTATINRRNHLLSTSLIFSF